MFKEFREFIMRGSVVDLAIAVVIGTAFAAVVKALVDGIITPLITMIVGEPSFTGLKFTINGSEFLYGNFLAALFTFLSVSAVIFFLIVKPMNAFLARRKREDVPAEPEAPTEDIRLLTEIRDLLSQRGV